MPIRVSTDPDYLSEHWHFAHPYNHAGLRWFEQVADQAVKDCVSIIVTGRGGDPSFGPQQSYGLSDVFSAPISWQEKWHMTLGAISTDWSFPALLQSIQTSSSLINEHSLSPTSVRQRATHTIPFLHPLPSHTEIDEHLYDVTHFSPQDLALETTVWQPRGIRIVHPYHHAAVQHLAASIPAAYRLIPYRGMRVVKPVLRLAFADSLLPMVVRQRRGAWLSVPHQEYCLREASYLAHLLASPTSHVVQRGIVLPDMLREVLNNTQCIRANYKELIATAMTELFLRDFAIGDNRPCR